MKQRPEDEVSCTPKATKVGMIGCGNMGRSMVTAWLKRGTLEPRQLLISARSSAEATAAALGVSARSTPALLNEADVIILGFKPQQLDAVVESLSAEPEAGLSGAVTPKLILSLLAGVTLAQLRRALVGVGLVHADSVFVRLMPNLPAHRSVGATLAYSERALGPENLAQVTSLLEALGAVEWLSSEGLFDVGTAISGCGPAYMFMIIEALADAGVSLGLPRDTAQRLAAQTMLGSGVMGLHEHPGVLKDRVTSPGGVTIQGVRALERAGIRSAMIEAVVCAAERSRSLGDA